MLVSLNWIRDYVDLPADLDPAALAERFTRTTAEVDGVHRIEVAARGPIAAQVKSTAPLSGNLRLAVLDVGSKQVETVTAAPKLSVGDKVVYAPPGASVAATGEIRLSTAGGRQSTGMILSADSLGIETGGQEAVFLSDEFKPGDALPCDLFDDWLIEIDNKSLTNRPDLWGHYGIAREIAAIASGVHQAARTSGKSSDVPTSARAEARGSLRPNPVKHGKLPADVRLPEIPIAIADAKACPRYSAIMIEGVGMQPAPLWMQLRLGHVGQRPISGLVDLTNYIMMDLGQPMHAFDAAKVGEIEVDWAAEGERFKTLDGVERILAKADLMIKSKGKSVGIAGVMGGLETEVSESTKSLLLESANFNGATVRRTATRLGLRTDASARFEKSLDPTNTVLGIERFVDLARTMFPSMKLVSRLSDAYPKPAEPGRVSVDPRHAARTIGREVPLSEAQNLLAPLGFELLQRGDGWEAAVPSFRATGDISIEADVIEELARRIGYDNIAPAMPHTTMRAFAVHELHELEQRSLRYFSTAQGYHEIQGYLWYDDEWLTQIGFQAGRTLELRNPAGAGLHRLRATLLPGMLAAAVRNRHHFDALKLMEVGSVYPLEGNAEYRHLGLILAQKGKNQETSLNDRIREALGSWAWEQFGKSAKFVETDPAQDRPWEAGARTAAVEIGGMAAGRIGMIDLALRRRMNDHLSAWGMVWAEMYLTGLAELPREIEKPGLIPAFPPVEMDFTFSVPKTKRYANISEYLSRFQHPLLQSVRYTASFEGGDKMNFDRSLTFRCVLSEPNRTLADADTGSFRSAFEEFAAQGGLSIKKT